MFYGYQPFLSNQIHFLVHPSPTHITESEVYSLSIIQLINLPKYSYFERLQSFTTINTGYYHHLEPMNLCELAY